MKCLCIYQLLTHFLEVFHAEDRGFGKKKLKGKLHGGIFNALFLK